MTDSVRGTKRRRAGGTWPVAATLLAVLVTSGCVSEVTQTRNGETVTESANEVPNSDDIDPCGLDEAFLLELSIDPADLVRGSGSRPTCDWEKGAYSDPKLYYWVEGATPADPANDIKVLDNGREVEIFYDSEGMARYILRTDDLTLNVFYSAPEPQPDGVLDPTAPEGVAAVIDQLLLLYGATG